MTALRLTDLCFSAPLIVKCLIFIDFSLFCSLWCCRLVSLNDRVSPFPHSGLPLLAAQGYMYGCSGYIVPGKLHYCTQHLVLTICPASFMAAQCSYSILQKALAWHTACLVYNVNMAALVVVQLVRFYVAVGKGGGIKGLNL